MRSMAREPESVPALIAEIAAANGQDARLDAAISDIETDLSDLARHEGQARRLVERLATLWCASLLVRHAPQPTRARRAGCKRAARDAGRRSSCARSCAD